MDTGLDCPVPPGSSNLINGIAYPLAQVFQTGDELVFGFDFYHFYAAARAFAAHQNPYDLCTYHAHLAALGWNGTNGLASFPYPPNFLPFIYPLAFLAPFFAAVVWLCFALLVVVFALNFTWQCLGKNISMARLAALAVIFPATSRMLIYGQSTFVVLGTWLGAVLLFEHSLLFFSGLVASLSLIKPHLALLPVTLFTLIDLRENKGRWTIGLLVGCALQLLLVSLVNFQVFSGYIASLPKVMATHEEISRKLLQTGTSGKFTYYCNAYFLPLFGIGAATLIFLKKQLSFRNRVLLALPLSILISPYLWLHDGFVLLPSLMVVAYFLRLLSLPSLLILSCIWLTTSKFFVAASFEWTIKFLGVVVFTFLFYILMKNGGTSAKITQLVCNRSRGT